MNVQTTVRSILRSKHFKSYNFLYNDCFNQMTQCAISILDNTSDREYYVRIAVLLGWANDASLCAFKATIVLWSLFKQIYSCLVNKFKSNFALDLARTTLANAKFNASKIMQVQTPKLWKNHCNLSMLQQACVRFAILERIIGVKSTELIDVKVLN